MARAVRIFVATLLFWFEAIVPSAAQTKLGAALVAQGRVVVTDAYRIGQVTGVGTVSDWEAVVVSAAASNLPPVKGLRVEAQQGGTVDKRRTSYVDVEDLEDLSRALGTLIGTGLPANTTQAYAGAGTVIQPPYRQADYIARGGLHVGLDFGIGKAFVSCGGPVDSALAMMNVADLATVKVFVDQAIAILKVK